MKFNKNLQIIALNIVGATLLIGVIIFATLKAIDNYTLHNQTIMVPSFKGMLPDEAERNAEAVKLHIKVTDSLSISPSLLPTLL